MDKVSIIVPVYNSGKYLERCIKSILAQSWNNFELIIVNDESTDNSQDIIDMMKQQDDRIICKNKKNGGPSSARNLGLGIATGKYILFCDSDDTVDSNWIVELVRTVQEHESSLCITGFRRVNENGEIISVHTISGGFYEKQTYYELIAPGLVGSTCNKIFIKKIIDQASLKFDEGVSHGEDVLFNLAYLDCMKDIFVIDKVTYNYYQYFSRETLSSKVPYEKRLYIFKARHPYIAEKYMRDFEKQFFMLAWDEVKNSLEITRKRSIIKDETFQHLLKKYGNEFFDVISLELLKCKKIGIFDGFQKISEIKKKIMRN